MAGLWEMISQLVQSGQQRPTVLPQVAEFTQEGPEYYARAYAHNSPWAVPGPYQTPLHPEEEKKFRAWVSNHKVPFDPDDPTPDYDMRGYWKASQAGQAEQWKGQGAHFPDTYKTPYDTTFSAESKYAKPGTPFVWQGDDLIDKRTGKKVFTQGGKEQ